MVRQAVAPSQHSASSWLTTQGREALVLCGFHQGFLPCWVHGERREELSKSSTTTYFPNTSGSQAHPQAHFRNLHSLLSPPKSRISSPTLSRTAPPWHKRRPENQLPPTSNITPSPSLERFPVPQGGQAEEEALLSTTQLPSSPCFPKEAFGLLLPLPMGVLQLPLL